MFVGFYLSGWTGINHEGKYTIAIEMGLQNSALAIFLANNVIQIDGLSLIAVLYGSFSFFSTLIIAYLMKDRKSTRLNSSHVRISYAVFCLKKKKKKI